MGTRILGVDPGLKTTGYGLIDCGQSQLKLIETGTIEPKVKDLFENRIQTIFNGMTKIILEHQPEVLILEKLYAHSHHPITASILGHARGVICLVAAQHKIQLLEESPKRIRKAITGNGNASKEQIKRFVAHCLKLDENKLTLDASDALALALGYVRLKGKNF